MKPFFCNIGLKYPIVFDEKVNLSEEIQKLDFHTESSEKIKCMVQGLASWLAQPNLLIKVLNQSGNTIFQKLAKIDFFFGILNEEVHS